MKNFTEYREGTIKFYDAVREYLEHGKRPDVLEKIMLLAYSLSKYVRDKEANGVSNPKLTGALQPIPRAIRRCVMLLERQDVDGLVKANVLEILSRSAYAELRKSRY